MPKTCYIHIPFCHHICSYCDFCKMYYNDQFVYDYLKALEKEIITNYQNEHLKTIYIGGGTPSCLKTKDLKQLFKILSKLKLANNYEFTFECNISDITTSLLETLSKNRINRLSIGIQSFNPTILKNIGRQELPDINKITLAKKYFSNINVDLIYGANNQTMIDLEEDITKFIALDVPHISLYSLILEDNTILKTQNYQEADDDLERSMYDLLRKKLKKANYLHYEISNFAKKGYFSKHNLTYWHNEEYYGFGLGAAGYINNYRYENTRSLTNYLKGFYRHHEYLVSKQENMENEMILGLRTIKGVSKTKFYRKFKQEIPEIFNVTKLESNKKYYYINKKDLFISNSILIDFIDTKEDN